MSTTRPLVGKFRFETDRLIVRNLRNTAVDALASQQLEDDYYADNDAELANIPLRTRDEMTVQQGLDWADTLKLRREHGDVSCGGFLKDSPDQVAVSVWFEHSALAPHWNLNLRTIRFFRNRGLMTEAVIPLLKVAGEAGMGKIRAQVEPENEASLAIMKKIGAKKADADKDFIHFIIRS